MTVPKVILSILTVTVLNLYEFEKRCPTLLALGSNWGWGGGY